MNENFQIAISLMGFSAVVLCPFVINRILKYKLEIAKVRAQMEVDREEIRARNQLEIEKLMQGHPKYSKTNSDNSVENGKRKFEESGDSLPNDRTDRERLRY